MISEHQRSQIAALLKSPQWAVIGQFADEYIAKIMADRSIEPTEWDTIVHTISNDGKIRGIREFLQELDKQMFHE